MVGALRQLQPTVLVAPWTEARHPDHAACGRLAEKALFFAGLAKYRPELGDRFRPNRLLYYPQRHEVAASLVVDISGVAEKKAAAVACHASQVGAGAATLVNQPLGLGRLGRARPLLGRVHRGRSG